MDSKDLEALELPKVLVGLAARAAFSASRDLALSLSPTADLAEARRRQAETSEARRLLELRPELSVGGARDVRPRVGAAARGAVLEPGDLLEIKDTLLSARDLRRSFEKLEQSFPELKAIAQGLFPSPEIVAAITRAISDRAEVLDGASPRLAEVRRELRLARDRLKSRLERLVTDPKFAPMLQEPIITQREGRFVVPLRAEYKGKLKSVVHDQSSSGATLFVEPLQVVEHNNRVRELELAEREEIRKVLTALSGRVGAEAAALEATVLALAGLDLAFTKARYAEDLRAEEPRLSEAGREARAQEALKGSEPEKRQPKARHPRMWLPAARHPLLNQASVVPVDLTLEPETQALVITGPNTGGKTVALKTAGLLALMAACGLHLPVAPGSALALFRAVFADIGDEQSIEQSLSTFSSHISNIIRILDQADEGSLVLLDELGAGTDPQEGSALARALLGTLVERGATALVATHFPELKAYAHLTPGVQNANVEFDLENLRPTYHLSIGLPGRSNALAIAERLGLSREIVERARSQLPAGELQADGLLDEIYRQRDAAAEAGAAAEAARREALSLRAELQERLRQIEQERQQILQSAREQSEAQLQELADELRELRRRMAAVSQPLEQTAAISADLEQLAAEAGELDALPAAELPEAEPPGEPWQVRLGEQVHLHRLDTEGEVTALDAEEAEIQIGRLRVRARLDELGPPRAAPSEVPAIRPTHSVSTVRLRAEAPPAELHLRGKTVEEALLELERRLDAAYSAGLPFLRIVHGKGTGRLREAVREMLRGHPYVAMVEPGGPREGGEGVTVVHLDTE
ncbi:MAG TPA: endonuclease MutS2 [Anaerolineales bacterium]